MSGSSLIQSLEAAEGGSRPMGAKRAPKRYSNLELAGWVAIAQQKLCLKIGDARALRELALNAGRFIGRERLDACSRPYETTLRPRTDISRRLPTRMARIRAALVDVGFPSASIENAVGEGYAMPVRHAERLCAMIEQRPISVTETRPENEGEVAVMNPADNSILRAREGGR